MRRHAAATILLGGWLLMAPPTNVSKEGKVDLGSDKPITAWSQVAAFDTAEECEHERAAQRHDADAKHEKYVKDGPAPEDQGQHLSRAVLNGMDKAIWSDALLARCVPAEAVYPAAAAPKK
jgi:hypothetical protein